MLRKEILLDDIIYDFKTDLPAINIIKFKNEILRLEKQKEKERFVAFNKKKNDYRKTIESLEKSIYKKLNKYLKLLDLSVSIDNIMIMLDEYKDNDIIINEDNITIYNDKTNFNYSVRTKKDHTSSLFVYAVYKMFLCENFIIISVVFDVNQFYYFKYGINGCCNAIGKNDSSICIIKMDSNIINKIRIDCCL